MTKTEDLPVIYEDNHLIVVLKQPNLLSQADHTQDDDMINLVKQYLKINIKNKEMFLLA